MSPDLAHLLMALGIAGVEVAAEGDRLRFRPSNLPDGLLDALRRHKPDLLRLLRDGWHPTDPEASLIYGERLGIADDLGMATVPGSPAWSIAVAESMAACCQSATIRVGCAA